MYYTTSGAYRKSKMLIDYATIALTAVIMILFILILFRAVTVESYFRSFSWQERLSTAYPG